jgi:hypothetical protein
LIAAEAHLNLLEGGKVPTTPPDDFDTKHGSTETTGAARARTDR